MPSQPPSPPPRKSNNQPAPKPLSSGAGKSPKFAKAVAGKIVPRIVLNAVEKWGKTSLGAFIPDVYLIHSASEDGYQPLLDKGLVPAIEKACIDSWVDLLSLLDGIIANPPDTKMLMFDALGGLEALCHEHVCQRDFNGVWTNEGFLSYHKGYEKAVIDWRQFLVRLDEIRIRHKIGILLLSHAQKRSFSNPMGENFDRFETDSHPKTWGATQRWADCILFGTFEAVVEKDSKGKSTRKGIGQAHRTIFTERRDAFDAGNRYGMPTVLNMTNDPAESWPIVERAILGDTK